MNYPDKLVVVVDWLHIGVGRQCSRGACPIALSLRQRWPDAFVVVNSRLNRRYPGIIIGDAYYPHTEESARYVEQIDDPHVFTFPNTFVLRRQTDGEA